MQESKADQQKRCCISQQYLYIFKHIIRQKLLNDFKGIITNGHADEGKIIRRVKNQKLSQSYILPIKILKELNVANVGKIEFTLIKKTKNGESNIKFDIEVNCDLQKTICISQQFLDTFKHIIKQTLLNSFKHLMF